MKKAILRFVLYSCALILPAAAYAAGEPTDNPVTSFYTPTPGEDYSWTDAIKWTDVFNVLDYGAVADGNYVGDGVGVTDNLTAFDAAIYDAWANGGGVVYVPAGTYYFSDHLLLRPGVSVRGETPVVTDAQDPNFKPPSRLEFPKFDFDQHLLTYDQRDLAFKFIGTLDSNESSNQAVVWLDINRAGIAIASGGSEVRNKVVFGTRTNNVAEPQGDVPQLTLDTDTETIPFQHEWQVHSWRFVDNISVYAGENVLVANNRCNDKHYNRDMSGSGEYLGDPSYVPPAGEEGDDFRMPGYIVQDKKKVIGGDNDKYELVAYDGTQAIFSYTNHYGITVRGSSGSIWGAAPYENPSLFRRSITIRDNWVYTTMRVSYHTSGNGLHIKDNIKKDLAGKTWWLHPNGDETVGNANTLENRGIDFAGSDLVIEGNDLQVQRHKLRDGPYLSIDGEGILLQECCGGTIMQNAVIDNNSANAYIGLYKMPYLRDIEITNNTLTEAGYIYVQADTNGAQFPLHNTLVDGNNLPNGNQIRMAGNSGGSGNVVSNNVGSGSNVIQIATVGLTLSGNTGFATPDQVIAPGGASDAPLAELLMPAGGPDYASDPTVDVTVIVDGSLLTPAPVDVAGLPAIASVSIYDNTTLIATLTSPTVTDAINVHYEYTASWSPGPGHHQLSAKVTPTGYSGSNTSTDWFTVTNVVFVDVAHTYDEWAASEFPGEDSPLIIGFGQDPDNDGLFNGVENAGGSAALVNSREPAPYVYDEGGTDYYTWRQLDDLGDLTLTVEETINFSVWSAVTATPEAVVDPSLPAGVSRYRVPLLDAGDIRVVRVRVDE